MSKKIIQLPKRKIRSIELSVIDWDDLYQFTEKMPAKENVVKDMLDNQVYFDPMLKTMMCLLEAQ